ncbi:hypothetical protein LXA43DRAFT_1064035 [Ganoderma leucocontextum]|nr:hypothetical protein LXA43DRAFT_1064035 [Ganoderma leucocontextum]
MDHRLHIGSPLNHCDLFCLRYFLSSCDHVVQDYSSTWARDSEQDPKPHISGILCRICVRVNHRPSGSGLCGKGAHSGRTRIGTGSSVLEISHTSSKGGPVAPRLLTAWKNPDTDSLEVCPPASASRGIQLNHIVFGTQVLSSQSLTYCRHYPHDRLFLKLLVVTIVLLETAQLLLFAAMAWFIVLGSGPSPHAFHLVSSCLLVLVAYGESRQPHLKGSMNPPPVLSVQGLASYVFDVNNSNPHLVIAVDAITGAVDMLLAGIFVIVIVPARPGSPGGNRLVNKLVICLQPSKPNGDIDGNGGQIFLNVNTGIVNTIWAFVALGLGQVNHSVELSVVQIGTITTRSERTLDSNTVKVATAVTA